MYDTDPGMELEAIENERFEADLQQAEWEREGRRLEALRAQGVCTHGSWVGFAINPDTGQVYYPEQEGLVGDQVRCTAGCGQVFASNEEIHEAHCSF